MLRTVIYIRKSSEDETEKQAGSVDRQRRDISRFIDDQNSIRPQETQFLFDPIKDIIVEDCSAKREGRQKFNAMIEKIKKKKYDILLCCDLSRLSRNPIDNGTLAVILDREYLYAIQTLTSIYTNNPTDKFTLSLFLAVAKYENDQRGKNTSSGMQSKKAKGGTTNLAPMGYKNVGDIKGSKYIEKDGVNFEILQEMWKKLATGQYKVSELYQEAKARGFTRIESIKGGKRSMPTEGAFREAFRNPYYQGLIELEGKLIEGKHPPMVTRGEFEQVQIILQKAGYKCSKKVEISYENLLKNLLVCGKSNKPMYLDVKTRYYCPAKDCSGRYYSSAGPKECPECKKIYDASKYTIEHRKYFTSRGEKHSLQEANGSIKKVSNISAELIENLVDKELSRIHINDRLFQIIRKQLYTLWLAKDAEVQKIKKLKRKEIEEKENQISNIIKNGLGNDEYQAEITSAIDELKLEIKNIESEISEISDRDEEAFEIIWQGFYALSQVNKVFGSPDIPFEPKRNLLFSVFSNLKFIDGKIIPEWQSFFAQLNQGGDLTKQKSQMESEISDGSSVWLPEQGSNLGPTG